MEHTLTINLYSRINHKEWRAYLRIALSSRMIFNVEFRITASCGKCCSPVLPESWLVNIQASPRHWDNIHWAYFQTSTSCLHISLFSDLFPLTWKFIQYCRLEKEELWPHPILSRGPEGIGAEILLGKTKSETQNFGVIKLEFLLILLRRQFFFFARVRYDFNHKTCIEKIICCSTEFCTETDPTKGYINTRTWCYERRQVNISKHWTFWWRFQDRERVVILGSGWVFRPNAMISAYQIHSWSGFVLSRELDKKKFQTVVVSPRSYFVFTPLLASTAVGTLEFRTTLESVRARGKGSVSFFLQSSIGMLYSPIQSRILPRLGRWCKLQREETTHRGRHSQETITRFW